MMLALHGSVLPAELWSAWITEPFAAVALGAFALAYGLGLERVWRRAGAGHGIRRSTARYFGLGFLLLALVLLSPLHALGETLFSAHMTQHVLLMTIAAPLLVLGRPLLVMLWALPRRARRLVGRGLRSRVGAGTWRVLSQPVVAWSIHALALWTWHIGVLYDASVRLRWVHAAQHATFFLAAMLFWWVLVFRLRGRAGAGIGVLYLFTTAVHASILGALLTFSSAPWYAAYATSTVSWGLTPLEDLQLGGLIMWIPGGLPYLLALLIVMSRWLAGTDARGPADRPALRVARP
jgi:putative membrane protein